MARPLSRSRSPPRSSADPPRVALGAKPPASAGARRAIGAAPPPPPPPRGSVAFAGQIPRPSATATPRRTVDGTLAKNAFPQPPGHSPPGHAARDPPPWKELVRVKQEKAAAAELERMAALVERNEEAASASDEPEERLYNLQDCCMSA